MWSKRREEERLMEELLARNKEVRYKEGVRIQAQYVA